MDKLNQELEQFVLEEKLSDEKIKRLVELKSTVDRLATKPYLSNETITELEKKYGVKPNVLTWGDYFQTEVATAHFKRNDAEFSVICNTIFFDLISSILIFTGKPAQFFQEVQDEAVMTRRISRENWTLEDEEKIHLDILANYFNEMGLSEECLSDTDYEWFHGFAAAKAV